MPIHSNSANMKTLPRPLSAHIGFSVWSRRTINFLAVAALLFCGGSAFCALPWEPKKLDETEMKVRAVWVEYYRKKGYDFDAKKMSREDMDQEFARSEREKQAKVLREATKALDDAKQRQLTEARKVAYQKRLEEERQLTPEQLAMKRAAAKVASLKSLVFARREAFNRQPTTASESSLNQAQSELLAAQMEELRLKVATQPPVRSGQWSTPEEDREEENSRRLKNIERQLNDIEVRRFLEGR